MPMDPWDKGEAVGDEVGFYCSWMSQDVSLWSLITKTYKKIFTSWITRYIEVKVMCEHEWTLMKVGIAYAFLEMQWHQ